MNVLYLPFFSQKDFITVTCPGPDFSVIHNDVFRFFLEAVLEMRSATKVGNVAAVRRNDRCARNNVFSTVGSERAKESLKIR